MGKRRVKTIWKCKLYSENFDCYINFVEKDFSVRNTHTYANLKARLNVSSYEITFGRKIMNDLLF